MCGRVEQTNKSYQSGLFFLAPEITLPRQKKKYCVVANNFAVIFKHDGSPTKSRLVKLSSLPDINFIYSVLNFDVTVLIFVEWTYRESLMPRPHNASLKIRDQSSALSKKKKTIQDYYTRDPTRRSGYIYDRDICCTRKHHQLSRMPVQRRYPLVEYW